MLKSEKKGGSEGPKWKNSIDLGEEWLTSAPQQREKNVTGPVRSRFKETKKKTATSPKTSFETFYFWSEKNFFLLFLHSFDQHWSIEVDFFDFDQK